ncbi:MAG: hypothetical protein ACRYFS_14185 [Janthinobacterium lividum]
MNDDMVSRNITLREIDTDRLVSIEDNREAIEFGVRLSEAPSDIWAQEFEQVYHQIPYTLKPPVRVEGDALRIVFLHRYAGELQGYLQFLALIVARANMETHRTEELHLSSTQEKWKAEFRDALRRVNLPQK